MRFAECLSALYVSLMVSRVHGSGAATAVGSKGSLAPFLNLGNLTKGTACAQDEATLWPKYAGAIFESSLQACSTQYAKLNTGISLQTGEMSRAVAKCMQNIPSFSIVNNTALFQGTDGGFSQPCAAAMGVLAECVSNECQMCVAGGSASFLCRECSVKSCSPAFYETGGLDTTCLPGETGCVETKRDLTPIIGGIAGGSVILIVVILTVLISKHNKNIQNERVAFAEALSAAALNAPKLSHRAPVMSTAQQSVVDSLERPLTCLYAFLAENDNELTVMENEQVTGIKIIDREWWFVRNSKGKFGLVPLDYVKEMEQQPASDSGSADVDF